MATTLEQARTYVRTASGIDVVAGLWVFLSPFILGFSSITGALWNNLIVGAAIIIFSATNAAGSGYKRAWPSWINVVLGIWLILSPFIIGFATLNRPLWNNIILGAVVVVLALISGASTPSSADDAI
ncbi:MAG TPA: SPW repeat protein [Patescibacteria group bacterium]|nr:SPW repeat protein [Patescibacteria group bacterium]